MSESTYIQGLIVEVADHRQWRHSESCPTGDTETGRDGVDWETADSMLL